MRELVANAVAAPRFSCTYVQSFADADPCDRALLGDKGAMLCALTQMGIKVPPGFVVTAQAGLAFGASSDGRWPRGLKEEILYRLTELERTTGRRLGDPERPLLLAVRCGTSTGVGTVFNVGINDEVLGALRDEYQDSLFVADSCWRFVRSFSVTALGVSSEQLEDWYADALASGSDMVGEGCHMLFELVHRQTGYIVPEDAHEQLWTAIAGVFNACADMRARRSKSEADAEHSDIAVSVMAMAFGNLSISSGAGVAVTRNPHSGERRVCGEFLFAAHGEDVSAGRRATHALDDLSRLMPEVWCGIQCMAADLERHFREVQEFEFTFERGVLYCLQTRNALLTADAATRSSVEMVQEGLIDKRRAMARVNIGDLRRTAKVSAGTLSSERALTQGKPISGTMACGAVVFDAASAIAQGQAGVAIILVCEELGPDEVKAIHAAAGVLTSHGDAASQVAATARYAGKPCIIGAEDVEIDAAAKMAFIRDTSLVEGDVLTIDGQTGNVYAGAVAASAMSAAPQREQLLAWADETKV